MWRMTPNSGYHLLMHELLCVIFHGGQAPNITGWYILLIYYCEQLLRIILYGGYFLILQDISFSSYVKGNHLLLINYCKWLLDTILCGSQISNILLPERQRVAIHIREMSDGAVVLLFPLTICHNFLHLRKFCVTPLKEIKYNCSFLHFPTPLTPSAYPIPSTVTMQSVLYLTSKHLSVNTNPNLLHRCWAKSPVGVFWPSEVLWIQGYI